MKSARTAMRIPGISVAVVEGDKLIFTTSDGFSDLENKTPAAAHTLWRIASVSKSIAATAAMQLVEQGKLKLDEPIWTYVPWYPRKGANIITVRHVLTHSSGIRHYDYEAGEKESTEYFRTVEAGLHINGVDREPLKFTPGSRYLYSSYAFLLVAGFVESASGLSFEGYLKERVFAPAGMTTAGLDKNRDLIPHRARFYRKTDSGSAVVNAPFVHVSNKWANPSPRKSSFLAMVADSGYRGWLEVEYEGPGGTPRTPSPVRPPAPPLGEREGALAHQRSAPKTPQPSAAGEELNPAPGKSSLRSISNLFPLANYDTPEPSPFRRCAFYL